MSKKRRKLKKATDAPAKGGATVHDRRATDLPFGARVAVETVDDPYAYREFATEMRAQRASDLQAPHVPSATELRTGDPPKVSVIVSLRDDPLRALRLRGDITPLQWMAGIRYRDDVDTSMIGAARAIDYSRPAVDGGGIGDPLRDSVSSALERLRRADAVLGHTGKHCCRAVLGEGLSVAAWARRAGVRTKHGFARATKQFRDYLDLLSEFYGLATRRAA